MKVHHTLICFFLMLQDGKPGVVTAGIPIYTGTEGGSITVGCSFTFSGSRRLFCKKECKKDKDVLIETEDKIARRGRYSIRYEEGTFPFSSTNIFVNISHLTKSDSGRYKCGLDRFFYSDSYKEFEIRVIDVSKPTTSKPKVTVRPPPPSLPSSTTRPSPSLPSASSPTTTAPRFSSSVGGSTPSSASSETAEQSETSSAGSGVLLYVGLVLVFMILVFLVAMLIFFRKRASKPKEPVGETVYANVTKGNRVYEDVREEDGRSRSPVVEMSVVYANASFAKPKRLRSPDDYSLASAAAATSPSTDDSGKLTYSEVRFLSGGAPSLSAAPGDADTALYSVPRAKVRPARHAEDPSLALYSTVASH